MRKITAVVLISALVLSTVTGCSRTGNAKKAGSGTPGKVDYIDWSDYDALYEASKKEKDPTKRMLILHEAEDLLMESGALIPLSQRATTLMKNSQVKNLFINGLGITDCSHAYKEGSDELKMQLTAELDDLDYGCGNTFDITIFSDLTQDGLVVLDEDANPKLSMAQSMEISEDGLTYTFTLKPDLKWSDGSPLGASDFVYTWKRNADPVTASESQDKLCYIAGYPDDLQVYASGDDRTLTVKLENPAPFFPGVLSFSCFYPIQQKFVESAEGYRNEKGEILNPSAWATEAGMPSCGPYVLKTWKHNESMTLEKNPLYWDADSIKNSKVFLMLSNDSTSAYAAYKVGDLDVCSSLPADEYEELTKSEDFMCRENLGSVMVAFNVNSDIWAGYTKEEAATIRKALAIIIDREFISSMTSSGCDKPVTQVVPYGMSDQNGGTYDNTDGYEYPCSEGGYYSVKPDYDKAREMLKSVGFEFGQDGRLKTPLSFEYLTNSGSANEILAACLQQDFAELGIQLYIKTEDWNVFLTDRNNGNYELSRSPWTADYNDPVAMLEVYTSDNPNNGPGLGKGREEN